MHVLNGLRVPQNYNINQPFVVERKNILVMSIDINSHFFKICDIHRESVISTRSFENYDENST